MRQYLKLVETILRDGYYTQDRTATGTINLPSFQYRIDMKDQDGMVEGFPLLTTKRMSLKSIYEELIWKLKGDTNIKFLIQNGNHIWTEWPFLNWLKQTNQFDTLPMWKDDEKSDYSDEWKERKHLFERLILDDQDFCSRWGELGTTYGKLFRNFHGVDQLREAQRLIREEPTSRRIIISLWDPTAETLLPPCPCFYQFTVEGNKLHLHLYQRSADVFLGVPYNTAQDALFLVLMARSCGLKAGSLTHTFNNAHLYKNHIDQARIQIARIPKQLPKLLVRGAKDILQYQFSELELIGYAPQAHIRGAVSI